MYLCKPPSKSDDSSDSDDDELDVGQRRKVVELDTHESNKENIESYFHSRRGASSSTSNKTLHDLQVK